MSDVLDSRPNFLNERAKSTAKKYDYTNVEFRLGEIENLPVEDNSWTWHTSELKELK